LTVPTSGNRGAGSQEPLPNGANVLLVEAVGVRTVVVEPWKDRKDGKDMR
jgi:hypothetical protein